MAQENVRLASVEEKAAAFDSLFHYGGTWRMEGTRVIHAVDYALNPNFPGTEQVREVELRGRDGLVLIDIAPDVTVAEIQEKTEATFTVAAGLKEAA